MKNLLERVSGRVIAIVLAIALGLVSAIALNSYVASEAGSVNDELRPVLVWRVLRDLPAGTLASDLVANSVGNADGSYTQTQLVGRVEALPDSLALGTITTAALADGISGFLARDVRAGEVLFDRMFSQAQPTATAFQIPAGQVAISVDVDVTEGVANFLDVGDRIGIMVTVGGAREDANAGGGAAEQATRFLLQNVEILAIGRRVTANATTATKETVVRNDGLLTLTVALDAADAERLVFATSTGELYIALLPDDVGDYTPTSTPGRNADNLFDR